MNRRIVSFVSGSVLLAAIVTVAGLGFPAPVMAQLNDICTPVRFIQSGATVERNIDDVDYVWAFCFDGEVGDTITIEVDIVSGNLQTFVSVLDSQTEDVIASSDAIDSVTGPGLLEFEIDVAAEYIIGVARVGGDSGVSQGTFSISFTQESANSGSVVVAGDCPANTAAIAPGDTLSGTVSDDNYFVSYCFTANEGDVVSFTAEATAGDLDTLLIVTNPDVTTNFAENDDCPGEGTNSCLELDIPTTGTYLVAVGRFGTETGLTTGDFALDYAVSSAGGTAVVEGGLQKDPVPGSESSTPIPDTPVAGDCDTYPVDTLVAGLWEVADDELVMNFDFDCEGQVAISMNGLDIGEADYSIDEEIDDTLTLTINLANGDNILFTNLIVAETGIIALYNDESLILLDNTLVAD